MTDTAIVWLRHDLRLDDNPALLHALESHECVIPLYLLLQQQDDPWPVGAASSSWLHHSLEHLGSSFEQRGSRLLLRRSDDALSSLRQLIEQSGAGAVYWNRQYEPHAIKRDSKIKQQLRDDGVDVHSFNASLLFEPWEVEKKDGGPFRVFTPFWKSCLQQGLPSSLDSAPDELPAVDDSLVSETLDELDLLPAIDWDRGFYDTLSPGEAGAREALDDFLDEVVKDYADDRDVPAVAGTSRLSVYLHFGEISPRQVIAASQHRAGERKALRGGIEAFERELGWREFAYHVLYHFPHTTDEPMNDQFKGFRWRRSKKDLEAWQRGRTGIPLVDAGMRELWHTGYMHNRVRMVVASFLTKNLLIHWREGARWFWDTLLDADLASNSMGWQWTAGSGADAAPYFRVFNPVSQSRKFDADGDYLKRWVPELAGLPAKHMHEPWAAPEEVLEDSGVYSEHGYPKPIVDLKATRQRALERYDEVRKNKDK